MELKEIHGKLSAKFGDSIGDWLEPEAGDAWIDVNPEVLHQVAEFLKNDSAMAFDFLRSLSGMDYVDQLGAVYHLFSFKHEHACALKVKVDKGGEGVASVMDLWPSADWHEREAYDMVGIKFTGRDGLTRILLPEDWEGHPLCKDYSQPDEYHGISHW